MTAAEARALMPKKETQSIYVLDGDIENRIKERAKNGANFLWINRLSDEMDKKLLSLGYQVKYSHIIHEHRISW